MQPERKNRHPNDSLKVAFHEAGHIIAFRLVGRVFSASIIPDSESLGRATGMVNPTRPLRERLYDSIFTCLAGQVAEEMVGETDHRGTRGDWGQARYLAEIGSLITGLSVKKILSDSLSACRSTLSKIGSTRLRQTAMHLWENGTVAY